MSNRDDSSAINLSKDFKEGIDISQREKQILKDISNKTHFIPDKVIWRSSYWGTKQIGAIHYLGEFKKQPAVLKIQGVKPNISEVSMIKEFAAQNRSKIIRPPIILATLLWNDKNKYEAFIMEYVTGKKILQSGQLQTQESIDNFLKVYQEYRKNCLPKKPWLQKPKLDSWKDLLGDLIKQSHKAYPDDPRRKDNDEKLVYQTAEILEKVYSNVFLEFIHGHFSIEDLAYQGNDVVLFSNLFWKWKYPFYDAVFGYHWFMYGLAHVKVITAKQVEEQRQLWLKELYFLPQIKNSKSNTCLLKAALLERAVAGIIIDSFLVDINSPIAEILTEGTRQQAIVLIKELSS